jgi:hypothetical protein
MKKSLPVEMFGMKAFGNFEDFANVDTSQNGVNHYTYATRELNSKTASTLAPLQHLQLRNLPLGYHSRHCIGWG